jgi:beta-galactosidase
MSDRLKLLFGLVLAALAVSSIGARAAQANGSDAAAAPQHTFRVEGGKFLLDGKPFQIVAGEIHYARIPREYWRARLRMAKAMGLNTITT